MIVRQYVTGSKSEFLSWVPEVGHQIFHNFQVDKIIVRVHGKPDSNDPEIRNFAELIYQEDMPCLSPDINNIRNAHLDIEDTRRMG